MKKWPDWAFLLVVAAVFGVAAGGFLLWVHSFNDGLSLTSTSSGGSGPGPGGPGTKTSNRLVIPSLGVNAPVVPEGSSGPDGGALDVPRDVHVIGWWDGRWKSPDGLVRERVAKPGDAGVALLAGHVDSAAQGHGALCRLQQVKPGAGVTVYGDQGAVTKWTVTRLQVVPKDALPRALFESSGPSRLAIVSCGGPFDSATGHYADNVIAWASPVQ